MVLLLWCQGSQLLKMSAIGFFTRIIGRLDFWPYRSFSIFIFFLMVSPLLLVIFLPFFTLNECYVFDKKIKILIICFYNIFISSLLIGSRNFLKWPTNVGYYIKNGYLKVVFHLHFSYHKFWKTCSLFQILYIFFLTHVAISPEYEYKPLLFPSLPLYCTFIRTIFCAIV